MDAMIKVQNLTDTTILRVNPPTTERFMTTQSDDKLDFIFGRRSIRAYTRDGVSDEAVQTLLEAAMAAPSSAACDP
jgi:hypothetical protein